MSDLLWNLFEIGVNLFESCVIIRFLCTFLGHDFKTLKGKVIYFIGILIDFTAVTLINGCVFYEGVFGMLYAALYFTYLLIFIKGTVFKKLLVSFLANAVMVCTNAGVSSMISVLFKSDLALIYENKSIERICMILCVQIIMVCIYDLILKYMLISLKILERGLILSVLILSFVSIAFVHITFININPDIFYARLMATAEFCLVMLNIVCFYITYALSKSNSEAEKLKMQKQQDEYRMHYAEGIKEQYEEMRRIRHDMKQNLTVISTLYKEGKYTEAGAYADKISDNISKPDIFIDVGNDFINAILNSKLSIAKARGIDVMCASSSNIGGIEDTDLCNLLGNMLDNAIEAAEKCSSGFIEVTINSSNDKIQVTVANSIQSSVLKNNRKLTTTKPDSSFHGYGVKTIRAIAEKYDGMANFYEDENMFYCQVIMYSRILQNHE